MWGLIRCCQLGVKFRRQVVLRGWIADFWCPSAKLVIEVDGGSHNGRAEADRFRDATLAHEIGARTLRFTNAMVMLKPDEVVAKIRQVLEAKS